MSTSNPDLQNLTTSAPAPPAPDPATAAKYHTSTLAIHADDPLRRLPDIAPPIHLSTTFHYPRDPAELYSVHERRDPDSTAAGDHIYSRSSTHNTTRLEAILTQLLHGESIVYGSGLAALHAVYVLLNPKRVAITGGYHGAHAVLAIMQRLTGISIVPLSEASSLGKGDIIHLETPVNPTGEARDIAHFAAIAAKTGASLLVDATFAPPELQDPFSLGADIVMHSGTKYFAGHSDALCGVLAVKHKAWATQLRDDRTSLGGVMGGVEAWLVVRSLRTLNLRVERASANVERLVGWLEGERLREGSEVAKFVKEVRHASLQPEAKDAGSWLKKQMPNGWGPVFAFVMKEREDAKRLPTLLKLFQHATSLGGVESLVEWRAMSDATVDEGLIRVSVGIEDWRDLKADLEAGIRALDKSSS